MIVRKATHDDYSWILKELEEFSEFYGSKHSLSGGTDEQKEATVNLLIEHHLFLVAESEGVLMGLIAGFVTPHMYNPAIKVLAEAFWWVSQEFRKQNVGEKLLDEFTLWAKENKINWVTMTIEDNSPAIEGFITGRGFKFKEKTFLLEV